MDDMTNLKFGLPSLTLKKAFTCCGACSQDMEQKHGSPSKSSNVRQQHTISGL